MCSQTEAERGRGGRPNSVGARELRRRFEDNSFASVYSKEHLLAKTGSE